MPGTDHSCKRSIIKKVLGQIMVVFKANLCVIYFIQKGCGSWTVMSNIGAYI